MINTYFYKLGLIRQALHNDFVLIASLLREWHFFWGASEVNVTVKAGSVGLFWGSDLAEEGGVRAVWVLSHRGLLRVLG